MSAPGAYELKCSLKIDLQAIFDHFRNKVFLLFLAQSFLARVLRRAYIDEGVSFIKTVLVISRYAVDNNANIVSSHVLYKVKIDKGVTFSIKA